MHSEDVDVYKKTEKFLEESKKVGLPPLLVILGATASGKTDLSIKIAKKYDGEVISTDSRQIYKYMDIGTAKVMPEEMEGVPHYMLDFVEPDQEFSLANFVDKAKEHIKDIHQRGKLPILIGGTGLYIRAICENYAIPRIPPNEKFREKLRKEIEKKGGDYVYEKLKKLDPEAAKKIHPNNHRYVIRAIEIAKFGGDIQKKGDPEYHILRFGIDWPREKLYERIDKRAGIQVEKGLIEETQGLLDKGFDLSLSSMSSLGYPEMISYINGERTLEEALGWLQKNTRNYAKRQITWFKKEPEVTWLPGEKYAG
ncbi:tRNA (adenosine(37)-N6)-dimethylallyltransferase MiaA [Patescibacteria group bacterium]